jgi:hypothetical protein
MTSNPKAPTSLLRGAQGERTEQRSRNIVQESEEQGRYPTDYESSGNEADNEEVSEDSDGQGEDETTFSEDEEPKWDLRSLRRHMAAKNFQEQKHLTRQRAAVGRRMQVHKTKNARTFQSVQHGEEKGHEDSGLGKNIEGELSKHRQPIKPLRIRRQPLSVKSPTLPTTFSDGYNFERELNMAFDDAMVSENMEEMTSTGNDDLG